MILASQTNRVKEDNYDEIVAIQRIMTDNSDIVFPKRSNSCCWSSCGRWKFTNYTLFQKSQNKNEKSISKNRVQFERSKCKTKY